jgi:hypothetical protein
MQRRAESARAGPRRPLIMLDQHEWPRTMWRQAPGRLSPPWPCLSWSGPSPVLLGVDLDGWLPGRRPRFQVPARPMCAAASSLLGQVIARQPSPFPCDSSVRRSSTGRAVEADAVHVVRRLVRQPRPAEMFSWLTMCDTQRFWLVTTRSTGARSGPGHPSLVVAGQGSNKNPLVDVTGRFSNPEVRAVVVEVAQLADGVKVEATNKSVRHLRHNASGGALSTASASKSSAICCETDMLAPRSVRWPSATESASAV